MQFLDCNASYGAGLTESGLRPVRCLDKLREAMKAAGVSGGAVYRVEQHDTGSVKRVNELLEHDVTSLRADTDQPRIWGVWTIVPSHTDEIPNPEEFASRMAACSVLGWRLCPANFRFMPRAFVLNDWLSVAVERSIPLFINTSHGTSLEATADLLQAFPDLTVILTYRDTSPNDRLLRPFISAFENVYIDTSYWFVDGCLEDFVAKYGSERLLYGSGYPYSYFGANMMMIRHAQISAEAKAAIAGGNLRRIAEAL